MGNLQSFLPHLTETAATMLLNTKSEAGVSQKQPLQPPTIHVIFLFICALAPGGSTQSRTRFIPMTSSIAPFQSSAPLSPDADKYRKTNACFDIEQDSDAEPSMAPPGADICCKKTFYPSVVSFLPFPHLAADTAMPTGHTHPLHYVDKTELST